MAQPQAFIIATEWAIASLGKEWFNTLKVRSHIERRMAVVRNRFLSESNSLTINERAWLWRTVSRYIRRTDMGWDIPDETTPIIIQIEAWSSFLGRITTRGVTNNEDRLMLLTVLRHERAQLAQLDEDTGQTETAFIDGFLARLARVDWEELGFADVPHNPEELWGGFRLTASQIHTVMHELQRNATFVELWSSLRAGGELHLGLADGREVVVFICRIVDYALDHGDGDDGKWTEKLFEGIVVETGEQVFGLLYAEGDGYAVAESPDSQLVLSCLRRARLGSD